MEITKDTLNPRKRSAIFLVIEERTLIMIFPDRLALIAAITLTANSPIINANQSNIYPMTHAKTEVNNLTSTAASQQQISSDLGSNFNWRSTTGLTDNAKDLIAAVETIENEGLDSSMYFASELTLLKQSNGFGKSLKFVNTLFKNAFTALVTDLGQGVTNPLKVQKDWYQPAPRIDSEQMYADIEKGAMSVEQALNKARPQDPAYADLSKVYGRWLKNLPQWSSIQPASTLELGTTHSDVELLRVRLIASGDLNDFENKSKVFDGSVESAVMRYQRRHGLSVDGKIGINTLNALNVSPSDRLEQIKINLERLRWRERDIESTKVIVNIPEFKLRMFNAGNKIVEFPIITGDVENQTPVFSKKINKLVVSPTWIIPYSIATKELLPLENSNPGYLKKENIDFFKWNRNGLVKVPSGQISRTAITTRPFQYVLQQSSGEHNALGRIKFMMPNKFNIYLHDTQNKGLFQKNFRAFSHGCIRLSEPSLLANIILQMNGYTQQEAKDLIAKTDTTEIKLETSIQTHLVYITAIVNENNHLVFPRDVYKKDVQLKTALNQTISKRIRQAKRRSARQLL